MFSFSDDQPNGMFANCTYDYPESVIVKDVLTWSLGWRT